MFVMCNTYGLASVSIQLGSFNTSLYEVGKKLEAKKRFKYVFGFVCFTSLHASLELVVFF